MCLRNLFRCLEHPQSKIRARRRRRTELCRSLRCPGKGMGCEWVKSWERSGWWEWQVFICSTCLWINSHEKTFGSLKVDRDTQSREILSWSWLGILCNLTQEIKQHFPAAAHTGEGLGENKRISWCKLRKQLFK